MNIGFWMCAVLIIPFGITGGLFALLKENAARFVIFSCNASKLRNRFGVVSEIIFPETPTT